MARISPELDLLYLQYKKVLFASPRDFLYLRFAQLNEEEGKFIVVTKSIRSDFFKPAATDGATIRGEIVLAGYHGEILSDGRI